MSFAHPGAADLEDYAPQLGEVSRADIKKGTLVFYRMEGRFPTTDDLELLTLCILSWRAADDVRYERAEATLAACRAFFDKFSEEVRGEPQ